VFTARYALSPYIKQTRFVFKGLNEDRRSMCVCVCVWGGSGCGCVCVCGCVEYLLNSPLQWTHLIINTTNKAGIWTGRKIHFSAACPIFPPFEDVFSIAPPCAVLHLKQVRIQKETRRKESPDAVWPVNNRIYCNYLLKVSYSRKSLTHFVLRKQKWNPQ
jgi:hypothetical protein